LCAVQRTNKFIAERDTGGAFISLWAARLESDGRVEFVDAGHGHWLIVRSSGSVEAAPPASGPPMGVLVEAGYVVGQAQLGLGDRLVLYTDGVCEALDSSGDQFGQAGVCSALSDSTGCEDDVERVLALVRSTGGQPADDATVMSIQWMG
jgi:phosphoserine phosphatase RsbU/P